MTATIRRVPRARGTLTDEQLRRLNRTRAKRDKAEAAHEDAKAAYRAEILKVLSEGGSFSEVHNATGVSTNTLQRWKKEAAD